MNRLLIITFLILLCYSCGIKHEIKKESKHHQFAYNKDLLLLNYDCKTDADDLHTIAAFASLVRLPNYSKINYYAVAGSYGIQKGEYIPANSLFKLVFNDRWSDAHTNYENAINEVYNKAIKTLNNGGNIWIAEAGQSDFSASLVKKIQNNTNQLNTKNRVFIVQHSDWNEQMTRAENLAFVKKHCNYQKIPDGNKANNGSPGYATSNPIDWENILDDKEILSIWTLATTLANTYNGVQNRYLNKTIKAGGLDFSDFSEVHHILNLEELNTCSAFFKFIQNENRP
ncbi:hypothetical protein [uncultured Winogradskyella sp.]|uniref:hypothetical protein n=1 Tax=uncultured Winogradskyella sp. TaxID=395353 RepID=UPI002639EFA2|nr:hypothetical protein [uncultured Winogradskyella sp.]